MLRNATTDFPWPISNNPFAKYNDPTHPADNLKFPLWQLVRASTAAPTYFPAEVIAIEGKPFYFVDGGVTMYNNPAFQMFLMATVDRYLDQGSARKKRLGDWDRRGTPLFQRARGQAPVRTTASSPRKCTFYSTQLASPRR